MSNESKYQQTNVNAIIGSIKEAAQRSDDDFMFWFDPSENVKESISRGYWDFSFNILTKEVCKYTADPHEKVAMEIGYGGGRLLNVACKYYKKAIGIDIHDEKIKVENFLKEQGNNNFKLLQTSGSLIDYESESVDLIYSFIVLCHMESLDTFNNYLKESYRCLKPGGIAQLYYAGFANAPRSIKKQMLFKSHFSTRPDLSAVSGPLVLPYTYIKQREVIKLCKQLNFKIVDTGVAYKKAPDGYPQKRGIQNYCTLLKL